MNKDDVVNAMLEDYPDCPKCEKLRAELERVTEEYFRLFVWGAGIMPFEMQRTGNEIFKGRIKAVKPKMGMAEIIETQRKIEGEDS